MADEARFSVRLTDKTSSPSRAAAKAVGKLSGELGGVRKVVGKTSSSLDRFSRALFGAKGGIKGARTELGHFQKGQLGLFQKSLARGQKAAGGMWQQVAGGHLAAEAIMRVGRLAAEAGRAAGSFVMFGERSELAFDQLAKHGATGPKLFELGRTLAKKYGQDIQDTTTNVQKLLAAQFDPKLATDIIAMGADMRVLGATAEETKGAVRAISQIKGAGKLMGDELLQLSEAGVPINAVREEIGRILGGKSTAEVIKLQAAGQIDADTAIQGVLSAVQRVSGSSKLGEAGARFADTTIEGMLGRGKAAAQDAVLGITSRITGPLNKSVGKRLASFSAFLESPEGVAMLDKIGGTLERVVGLADKFVSGFGDGFGEAFKVVGDGAKALFAPFTGGDGKRASVIIKSIGRTVGQMTAALAVGVGILGGVAAGLSVLVNTGHHVMRAIVVGIVDPLGKMLGNFVVWWDDLKTFFDAEGVSLGTKMTQIGKHIVQGLGDGIKAMARYPLDALKGIGSGAIDAMKKTLGIASPSKVFAALGKDTAAGYTIGVDAERSSVRAAGVGMADAHLGGVRTGFGMPSGSLDLGGNTSAFDFGDLTSAALPAPRLDSSQVGGGGVRIGTIPIEVTTGSGDPGEIARTVKREFRREMDDYFREMDLEG